MLRNRAFFRPRSSALALEPRVMFDAAGAMAASDHMFSADLDVSQGDGTTPDNAPALRASEADTPAAPAPDTLLIIDARVSNYQGLLTDLPGTVQVRVIQVGESGLNAITAALQGTSGLRSIQIISHGSSGNVTLGSDALNSATLSSHSAQVQAWGSHLSADADILLFGCDVAAGPGGSTLLTQLATLTGAVIVGLGHHRTGLLANDDELCARLLAAGERSGEPLWRLPLDQEYSKQLRSEIADLKNVGKKDGGAITAAAFLKEFVGETPWAHLDIAGTAWDFTEKSYIPKGPSGIAVRTLFNFVRNWKG